MTCLQQSKALTYHYNLHSVIIHPLDINRNITFLSREVFLEQYVYVYVKQNNTKFDKVSDNTFLCDLIFLPAGVRRGAW